MKDKTDYNQVYRIARAYYIKGDSEKTIASREGLSRPHVSRLLTKARQIGMVSINVSMPQSRNVLEYEKKLKEKLKLEDVRVASMSPKIIDQQAISIELSKFASQILPGMLVEARNLGVGVGYTIYNIGKMLDNSLNKYNMSIAPLCGYTNSTDPYYQTTIIANDFSEKLKSSAYFAQIPFIVKKDEMSVQEEKSYETLNSLWNDIDTVVMGIGGINRYHRVTDFLVKGEKRVIGDLLSTLILEDGSVADLKEGYLYITYDVQKLRDVKNVICIGGGREKVKCIIACAKKGYFKTLITDSVTAKMILEVLE